ncbi:phospholipid scramblase 2-like [Ctenopharyngodon idella]|uniref:phospholipid scramblase 2-like n=1 Tax=Ctenopharyngodon idella TaxID=7959 RepID=UPI002232061C|nr:phospholipid scramblase 2-like [Ctenopharyngodon idella]
MELSDDIATIPCPDPYHCPCHMETLTCIDQLFVYKEQHLDECFDEVCCGINANNRYKVKDDIGNNVFSILEDSDYCSRHLTEGRSFIMNVINHSNQEIIRLVHPFVCSTCSHELEVQSPPGIASGHVWQNWHVCLPKFTVENERGEPAFKIVGPCVPFTFYTDENFELVSLNGAAIDRPFGKIFKPFSCCGLNGGADFVDFIYYDKPKSPVRRVLHLFGSAAAIKFV